MAAIGFGGRGRLPVVLQTEKQECGLSCLAMVLGYFGRRIGIAALRRQCPVSEHGATLSYLMRAADRMGLAARPLRLEMSELRRLNVPAILHWGMNHFVVLRDVRGRKVHIHDPALGKRSYPHSHVARHFTGVALELTPTADFIREETGEKIRFRDLWQNISGLPKYLAQLLLLSFVLQLFTLAMPFYSQILIDDVLVNRDLDLLQVLAAGFLLVVVVKCCTEGLRAWIVLYLGSRISFHFATSVCRHLLRLPMDYFSRRHVGDIVSRFSSLEKLKEFLCSGIIEIVIDGIMVVTTLCLMFFYSAQLTWLALVVVVLYGLLRILLYRLFYVRNEEVLHYKALENTNFIENLHAMQGIKLFGREGDRLRIWQNHYADVINAGIGLEKLDIGVRFAQGLLLGGGNVFLVLLGGYAVIDNQLSVGMIVAYLSFKDQFYNRVFTLLDSCIEFKLLDVHLARLADIALHKAEEPERIASVPVSGTANDRGSLELDNIAFRYPGEDDYLFRDVSLVLGAEEAVALVGPSGCGKTTLLKIVMSLLAPDRGRVRFHGRDVEDMGLSAYRNLIAGVMQDDRLLTGSIIDNITFFDQQGDPERVRECARLAAVARDIERMPMQYDTLVGSMGAALSGGQIQRILLARAIYRRPRLLVLDEASSHLDAATEKAVNEALRAMHIPRLIVAHRPGTVALADRVFELGATGLRPG